MVFVFELCLFIPSTEIITHYTFYARGTTLMSIDLDMTNYSIFMESNY